MYRNGAQRGKIIPVGVCEQPDSIMPFFGLIKELQIQFAIAYTKDDFDTCVAMLGERRIDVSPMITDIVGLDELPDAFEALRTPSHQCKVLDPDGLIRVPEVVHPDNLVPAVVKRIALVHSAATQSFSETLALPAMTSLASLPTGIRKGGWSAVMASSIACATSRGMAGRPARIRKSVSAAARSPDTGEGPLRA